MLRFGTNQVCLSGASPDKSNLDISFLRCQVRFSGTFVYKSLSDITVPIRPALLVTRRKHCAKALSCGADLCGDPFAGLLVEGFLAYPHTVSCHAHIVFPPYRNRNRSATGCRSASAPGTSAIVPNSRSNGNVFRSVGKRRGIKREGQ